MYSNGLDDNITSNVLKVDTKVFRKINHDGDKQHLQNDIDKLVKWSEKRQILLIFFNVNAYIHVTGTWK